MPQLTLYAAGHDGATPEGFQAQLTNPQLALGLTEGTSNVSSTAGVQNADVGSYFSFTLDGVPSGSRINSVTLEPRQWINDVTRGGVGWRLDSPAGTEVSSEVYGALSMTTSPSTGTPGQGNTYTFATVPSADKLPALRARVRFRRTSGTSATYVLDWVRITVDYTPPPQANDDSYTTDAEQALNGSSVLANDTSPSGASLTAVKVSDPVYGSVALNSDGTFTYTPAPGYSGFDTFTYKANDGTLDSNIAVVGITVNAAPPPPPPPEPSVSSGLVVPLLMTYIPAYWTNMPSAETEFDRDKFTRVKVDLTHVAKARIMVGVEKSGASTAELRLQYSTDAATWHYLDGVDGPKVPITSVGTKVSPAVDLESAAKADVFLRVVGVGGDGHAEPAIRSIYLQQVV